MLRSLSVLLLVAILAYAALCAVVYFQQRSMLYFPQPQRGYDAPLLRLSTAQGVVNVSMRANDGPDAVIYFGGNAEDTSMNLPLLVQAFPDHALYLMHYRGFGGSSGALSEAALQADALALFDVVKKTHSNIIVIGRSLGSGVAIQLAAERPVRRLVMVTPFSSITELALLHYPWLPVQQLLQDRYESWRAAPKITVPTTLIVASDDEVIPAASSQRLRESFASGIANYVSLAHTDHNSISQHPSYIAALRATSIER